MFVFIVLCLIGMDVWVFSKYVKNRPVFQENNHTTKQKLCMGTLLHRGGLTDGRLRHNQILLHGEMAKFLY